MAESIDTIRSADAYESAISAGRPGGRPRTGGTGPTGPFTTRCPQNSATTRLSDAGAWMDPNHVLTTFNGSR